MFGKDGKYKSDVTCPKEETNKIIIKKLMLWFTDFLFNPLFILAIALGGDGDILECIIFIS